MKVPKVDLLFLDITHMLLNTGHFGAFTMARSLLLSIAIVATLAAVCCSAARAPIDHVAVIQDYVNSIEKASGVESEDLCLKYPCCDMQTDPSGCALRNMPKLPSTLVFPGGETRCIFSTSTPYSFQVWPGASDRVLLYFQGGGACWDQGSTVSHFCTTNTSPQPTIGIFDRENVDNKYSNYTIVHALYCSGDMFVGNVVRPYTDSNGVPVTQRVCISNLISNTLRMHVCHNGGES